MSNLIKNDNELFVEYDDDNNSQVNLAISNPNGGPTMFVNAKQYLAIQRRRMKKMNSLKKHNFGKLKKRVKFEKRSLHAKKRIRTKDGKFISRPDNSTQTEASAKEGTNRSRDITKSTIEK